MNTVFKEGAGALEKYQPCIVKRLEIAVQTQIKPKEIFIAFNVFDQALSEQTLQFNIHIQINMRRCFSSDSNYFFVCLISGYYSVV